VSTLKNKFPLCFNKNSIEPKLNILIKLFMVLMEVKVIDFFTS